MILCWRGCSGVRLQRLSSLANTSCCQGVLFTVRIRRRYAGTKNDLVRKLIDAINEATDTIPGWDNYIRDRAAKSTELWDGKTFGKSTIAAKEMAEA